MPPAVGMLCRSTVVVLCREAGADESRGARSLLLRWSGALAFSLARSLARYSLSISDTHDAMSCDPALDTDIPRLGCSCTPCSATVRALSSCCC
eukprot:469654-Rhodomonas_salina.1